MKVNKLIAMRRNYGAKRSRKKIKAIVIHYTANKGDTARNNAEYFRNNYTGTSAHFFIDGKGVVYKSVPMNRVAYAVGKDYRSKEYPDGGIYYGYYNNSNTVSIELCNFTDRVIPPKKQIESLAEVIKYIRKYCPNAKTIIRHYDVNGKLCPKTLVQKEHWNQFRKELKKVWC